MRSKIFRRSAVDRLRDPERTDHPLFLVGAVGWLFLATLLTLASFAATWALVTSVPIQTSIQGTVIALSGDSEIVVNLGTSSGARLSRGMAVEITAEDAAQTIVNLSAELVDFGVSHRDPDPPLANESVASTNMWIEARLRLIDSANLLTGAIFRGHITLERQTFAAWILSPDDKSQLPGLSHE